MTVQDTYRVNSSKVLFDRFDNEVIAINNINGNYYSLRGVASVIWRLLEVGATMDRITELVSSQFTGDATVIASTVSGFVDQLVGEDLVVASEGSGDLADLEDVEPGTEQPYEAPRLEVYSDMQDLLLLDPIHEVDQTGWPNKPDDTTKT